MRKKNTFQISIPEPCDQKWEDMTPQKKGRFCQQCTKTIIDFSQKTDREIALVFKESEGQLCGRFSNDQLNRDILLLTALKNNSQWKAAGLMLSAMITMSACNDENKMTTGSIAPIEQFDNQEDTEILKEISTQKWNLDDPKQELMYATGVMVSSDYMVQPPKSSKYIFGLILTFVLGGILLLIFILEMIARVI